jgi:hypothetical protein
MINNDDTINSIQIDGFSGVSLGYVILPTDIKRQDYIDYCFSNERVILFDNEYRGVVKNVQISKDLLQQIVFPEKIKSMGSPLIYAKMPISKTGFVIKVLQYRDNQTKIFENTFNIQKKLGKNTVSIVGDLNENTFDIDIFTESESTMNLSVKGNKDSSLNLNSDGKIKLNSIGGVSIESADNINIVAAKSVIISELEELLISLSNTDKTLTLNKDKFDISMPIGSEVSIQGETDNVVLYNNLQNILRKMVIQIQVIAASLGIPSAAELTYTIEEEYKETKGKIKTS